jgi:hypothetical protein
MHGLKTCVIVAVFLLAAAPAALAGRSGPRGISNPTPARPHDLSRPAPLSRPTFQRAPKGTIEVEQVPVRLRAAIPAERRVGTGGAHEG